MNRFKNHTNWNYILPDSLTPQIIAGHILSGECLIDSAEFRDALLDKFDSAKGGEMEGAGFFAAAVSKNLPWIIVKGICDFADGNKAENKVQFQITAANSSVSFCQNILNNGLAFEEINIFAIDHALPVMNRIGNVSPNAIDPKLLKSVLFNLYAPEMESYYLARDHDENIQSILHHSNLWLSGPIGCGKTNLAVRALYKNSMTFRLISFANYIGTDLTCLFRYLYLELLDCIQNSTDKYNPSDDLMTVVKKICDLLSTKRDENLCIYIEEISNIDEVIIEAFIQQIFGILIGLKSTTLNSQVRFVFSSITEPLSRSKRTTKNKIHEQITFYKLGPWQHEQLSNLLSLIVRELKLHLSKDDSIKIINAADGSPRFVKQLIRKRLILNSADSLDSLITETKGELF